jgi:hypothetical protein
MGGYTSSGIDLAIGSAGLVIRGIAIAVGAILLLVVIEFILWVFHDGEWGRWLATNTVAIGVGLTWLWIQRDWTIRGIAIAIGAILLLLVIEVLLWDAFWVSWRGWLATHVVVTAVTALAIVFTSMFLELERKERIVDQVRSLSSPCDSGSAKVERRGRALIWDLEGNGQSGAQDMLPSHLAASSSDHHITVVMIVAKRKEQVGTYSISGQPAYKQLVDLCIVYWPERTVAGEATIVSEEPHFVRPVEENPEFGDPSQPIAEWVTRLPT